jgi:2-polyprenyl-3-methyl-5-hydroxy-6-metoxy-1,4-benzoquinol methylase
MRFRLAFGGFMRISERQTRAKSIECAALISSRSVRMQQFMATSDRDETDNPAVSVSSILPKPNHAFGVDPTRPQLFSLRQARYDAAAEDISNWAGEAAREGEVLTVLDVGCKHGTLLRHLEHRPFFENIRLTGSDITAYNVYNRELYHQIVISDLMAGQPEIPAASFDVVVCEQVLEHLEQLELAIPSLERILKPGGRLIVGVPIFIPLLAFLRRRYVALTLALNPSRHWSHIQSFSLSTFLRTMRRHSNLELVNVRGCRIISEGLVAPLENYRWWWKFNRKIGVLIPFACTEVQAVFVKRSPH